VTADHGEVEVGDRWYELTRLQSLMAGASGEGRFRWIEARRGARDELLAAAQEEFGSLAWVMSRDEVLDDGWLGPGPVPASSRRRLGDVALMAREPVGFIDPAMPREGQLIGAHGSLTSAEMLVPLVAASGRLGETVR
jgi:hypothetical protein